MYRRPAASCALILVLVGTMVVGIAPHPVRALGAPSALSAEQVASLSPYWHSRMQRWTPLIVQEATRRGFDPDLLAALIWKESRGDPNAIGPAGSVGLMQVMPKEAGFSWRPTTSELLDPHLNVFWGTRTLSIILGQGKGDIFGALAAYNGGWRRSTSAGPVRFAASILLDYGRAVAARHGVEGQWTAYIAVRGGTLNGPVYVINPDTGDVWSLADVAAHPEGYVPLPSEPPLVEVGSVSDDEDGVVYTVGLYILSIDRQEWLVSSDGTPAEVEATRPVTRSPSLMAGSQPWR